MIGHTEAEGLEGSPFLTSTAARARRGLAVAALGYAVVATAAIAIAPSSNHAWRLLPDWVAVPVQLIAIASSATLLPRDRRALRTGTIWTLIWAFCVLSLVANFVWNWWRPLGAVPSLSFVDSFYLADYAVMTAACALIFLRFGGSFRDVRTWLDAVTIIAALLGVFWGALLGTHLPTPHEQRIGLPYAMTYAGSVAVWMTMATLAFLRMPGLPPVPLLLLGAGMLDALWEVGWLATWLTDRNYVGSFYNGGDLLCFALIACAAALGSPQQANRGKSEDERRSAHAFVPTLAMLLAIGIVGGSLASTRAPEVWILVGLVSLMAVLLVVRQSMASRKLADLNRELAFRVADARLTELVRQSTDAFLVLDARGRVLFASPAIRRHAGTAPCDAVGARVAALFGVEHEETLARFVERLIEAREPPAPLELSLEPPHLPRRVLRVQGANRLDNVHIRGLTLTISDISEQRALERDLLTAANLERLRFAGDIHEGLGQELSGIALMLQGLSKADDLRAAQPRIELRGIVDQMRAAIHGARDLARGLSPIYEVRGSLPDALRRLARNDDADTAVCVFVDPSLDGFAIDELPADHLYRIACEAVQIARERGSRQVEIRLRRTVRQLLLEIACGGDADRPVLDDEYSLRLMEYRARIVGATFDISGTHEGGRLVRVAVRLLNPVRDAAIG